MMRGPTSPIARVNDARDELAKAWALEIVERTPVSELGDIALDWVAREAPPLIASITLAAPYNSLRTFAPVSGQRATHIVLRLGELATLAPYVTLVALLRSICVRGMV